MGYKEKTLILRSKEWLQAEYSDNRKSSGEIATALGCTDSCVQWWLKRHGISRRTQTEARSVKQWGPEKRVLSNDVIAARIKLAVSVDETTGCWNWRRGLFTNGYPCIKVSGKSRKGNRVSYEVFKGPIGDGILVCHECDNKLCVNPDHLWLGTTMDNIADRDNKGRTTKGTAHHSNKLDEASVLKIRSDVRPYTQISKEYGVSATVISRIKNRQIWKSI